MNNEELTKLILIIVAGVAKVDIDTIDMDASLEGYGIDSLKAITTLYAIEDRLDIVIPNEALDQVKSVSDIIRVVTGIIEAER